MQRFWKISIIIACLTLSLALTFPREGQGQERPLPPLPAGPASVSTTPAEVTFDYSQSKGEYSKYLFSVIDSPYPLEEGVRLAKEANFKVVAMIHFLTDIAKPEEKARLLAKYGLEGMLFCEGEAGRYSSANAVRQTADAVLNKIDSLKKKYPGFNVRVILFGNEPDIPEQIHWKGTSEQFVNNYAVFVRRVKERNQNYLVGTPGFAPDVFFPGNRGSWMEDVIKSLSRHQVPADFISFHSYYTGVSRSFTGRLLYLKRLLSQYQVRSPIFGSPKLANNEFGFKPTPYQEPQYYRELDTAWRAAHGIMAVSSMVDQGLWMACEYGSPFRNILPGDLKETDWLWISKKGTIKPIYYAWKAFNNLAETIEIPQRGSNFETFGALAGKSAKDDSLVIILSSYDEYAFFQAYPDPNWIPQQSRNVPSYKSYKILIKNLPWREKDKIVLERYLVDDINKLALVEKTELPGGSELAIQREVGLPQVQLIKIYQRP
jgi:hypothetical protein